MVEKTLTQKENFIERLRWMPSEQFQELKKTEEYRALITDSEVKGQLQAMLAERRSKERKRIKLLDVLYTSPETLEWIKDIQAYRDLRCLQVILAQDLSDSDNKLWWSSLDKSRRDYHNKALTAFCRMTMRASPESNRSNTPVIPGSSFGVRDDAEGDLYAGPLMIPYEEVNSYGDHDVRDSMTTGMFQLLILIEETARSDWEIAKNKAFERIQLRGVVVDKENVPDINEIQMDLIRSRRSCGAKGGSPTRDDFDPSEIE